MDQKYDLYSAEFRKHAHEVYAYMRKEDPVLQQPGINGKTPIWFVTRYTDVEKVLLDSDHFVRDASLAFTPEEMVAFNEGSDPRIDAMINNHVLNRDGETHHRLRSLVSKAFTPRVVASMRPRIEAIAQELLDQVVDKGEMDLVGEYAFPLPIIVIAELLGIPVEDRGKFRLWSNAVVAPALTPEAQEESKRLLYELADYMEKLVRERRINPGKDLLSGLILAEEAGDRLDESELFSMLTLLVVAGHETTVTLIGNAVLALLQNPDQLGMFIREPSLSGQAVEELLRYDSPVDRALVRFVAEDVELGGKSLKRGDFIIVILGSANRDEQNFECPHDLNLSRQKNPHLAFGKGSHYCLGAPLARLEGEIALRTLFQRLPNLCLAVPAEDLVWRQVPLFRSLVQLPVRWES